MVPRLKESLNHAGCGFHIQDKELTHSAHFLGLIVPTLLCVSITPIQSQNISLIQNIIRSSSHSFFPPFILRAPTPTPSDHSTACVSMNLCVTDISRRWGCPAGGFLCLAPRDLLLHRGFHSAAALASIHCSRRLANSAWCEFIHHFVCVFFLIWASGLFLQFVHNTAMDVNKNSRLCIQVFEISV